MKDEEDIDEFLKFIKKKNKKSHFNRYLKRGIRVNF